MIDENVDEWVSPEEVAQVMVNLIEKEENVGGTVLEVGKGKVRRVEALNDPGPEGSGHTISNVGAEEKEIWERLERQAGK
jgi:3-hydroxybutyrate dehydrogenase